MRARVAAKVMAGARTRNTTTSTSWSTICGNLGRERQDERIEQARQRYDRARGHAGPGGRGADQDAREVAHRFSAAETKALIERGWRAPAVADGFKNHGERVQAMVELAKRLGYGAKVGALQANFGTPYENDIARIEAELAQPDLDPSRRAELEAKLDAAVAAAKPGNGANHDWARADLDNDDGMVDQRDLETLDAAGGAGSDGGSGAPAASERPSSAQRRAHGDLLVPKLDLAPLSVVLLLGACVGPTRRIRALPELDRPRRRSGRGPAAGDAQAAPDGAMRSWLNPTAAMGTITPTRTYLSAAGTFCRDYREELVLGDQTGRFHHSACRDDGAGWRWPLTTAAPCDRRRRRRWPRRAVLLELDSDAPGHADPISRHDDGLVVIS